MTAALAEQFDIPARAGRSFTVEAGKELRIVAVEGPQAADVIAWNAHDIRESMSSWVTQNVAHSFRNASEIYSKLPAGRVMFRVVDPRPGLLWISPGRCSRMKYADPSHPNCQDTLAALVEPFGLSAFDVPEVLNVFMDVRFDEHGSYRFLPSPIGAGDYLALVAEMDVVVGVSACPAEDGFNVGGPKPIRIEIRDPEPVA
jgi:uncharacterized protein YcgI (DUF1989 family)